MNEFVEECRSEWKRLGVSDAFANEMAADLAADLEEAEAEGASPEEVLGSGTFDPRSFATAWAAERGVIGRPLAGTHERMRGSRLAAAIATFALVIAIVGAVLVIVDSPADPGRLALSSPADPPRGAVWVAAPDVRGPAPPPGVMSFTVDGTSRVVMLALPPPPSARIVADTDDSGLDSRSVGSILLIIGLAGAVPSTLLLSWLGPGRGRAAVRTTSTV